MADAEADVGVSPSQASVVTSLSSFTGRTSQAGQAFVGEALGRTRMISATAHHSAKHFPVRAAQL
jgi:hypothetical protein